MLCNEINDRNCIGADFMSRWIAPSQRKRPLLCERSGQGQLRRADSDGRGGRSGTFSALEVGVLFSVDIDAATQQKRTESHTEGGTGFASSITVFLFYSLSFDPSIHLSFHPYCLHLSFYPSIHTASIYPHIHSSTLLSIHPSKESQRIFITTRTMILVINIDGMFIRGVLSCSIPNVQKHGTAYCRHWTCR